MKKHYETHVEDTDKLISVAGPVLDYKSWYEQYRKLMEEQAQRKYGLYTPTSEGDDDDFPSIPGMIARYSALGLTNEQMAANPVWADKTGNGHDLQMKNFVWGGMSGVGGYGDNFSSDSWKKPSDRSDITWTSSSFNITRVMNTGVQIYYFSTWEESESVIPEKRIIVKGLEDGQVLRYMNVGNRIIEISQDGIYTIPSFTFKGANSYHGYSLAKKQESCNVTVEQLPLYPGALVFDGVDDYGVCDNFPILTKEKGYTVVALRQWISMGEGISGLVSNVKNWFNDGAFILEYNSNNATNKFVNRPVSFGNVNIEMDLPNNFTYQTSKSYKGVPITTGSFKGTNSLLLGKLNNIIGNYSNVAIWELVFLDHDATEEELTKIKDYFVKTYPWLFPDQAWTVTGKTNEDEDRATIANITGNGNDLVLSNFSFSKSSGYGIYQQDFNRWVKPASRIDATMEGTTVFKISSIKQANITQLYYQSGGSQQPFVVPAFKIKVSGLTDEQKLRYQYREADGTSFFDIDTDGIYDLPSFDFLASGNVYGFIFSKVQETCDITIEQIPEYEGYLVTDGVDDRVQDNSFKLNKDWTLVGEWVLLNQKATNAGIVKPFSFVIYNRTTGLSLFINSGTSGITIENVKSIKAICSDGRIYLDDWSEMLISKDQDITSSTSVLSIGFNGTAYTQMAFKNLGIYNNQILSKDDCIKAYNYLQTLKSK